MKIAMFGTFDVGNFGDIFFPIVAEKKLAEFGPAEVTRFSYRAKSKDSWCYDVEPIQSFPDRASEFDLVLVGGGHLLHFNRYVAPGYGPTDPMIPHPLGFWWLPAVAGAMAQIPVALHCPSASPFVPEWAHPLMLAFMDSIDYAAVRDEGSLANLKRFVGPGKDISLVPDSVFSVSDFLHRGQPSPEYQALAAESGIGANYLVLQPSDILRPHMAAVRELVQAAHDRGWEVLELPIFNEHLNYPGLFGDLPGIRRIRDWPDPLLLAEVIANAQAVVGVSLHLSIVASSYGIPVYRTPFANNSKFILLNRFPNIHFLGDGRPLCGWSDAEPDMSVALDVKAQLQNHWRRLAETARPPGPATHARGWEQLCATPKNFRQNRNGTDTRREVTADLVHRRQLMFFHLRRSLARKVR